MVPKEVVPDGWMPPKGAKGLMTSGWVPPSSPDERPKGWMAPSRVDGRRRAHHRLRDDRGEAVGGFDKCGLPHGDRQLRNVRAGRGAAAKRARQERPVHVLHRDAAKDTQSSTASGGPALGRHPSHKLLLCAGQQRRSRFQCCQEPAQVARPSTRQFAAQEPSGRTLSGLGMQVQPFGREPEQVHERTMQCMRRVALAPSSCGTT
jgi:hypothetical protein